MTVDGNAHVAEVEPRLLLLHHLRENLGIGGVHAGCNTTSCGACTVHIDGESVKSCTVLAVQADGHEITTVRGITENGVWHPMQQAFHEAHGLQCGYCTPGMIMASISLLKENPGRDGAGDKGGPRREPVPLHGLREHREGRPARPAAHGRAGPARGILEEERE